MQIKNSLRNFLHAHSSPSKEKYGHSQFSKNGSSASNRQPMRKYTSSFYENWKRGEKVWLLLLALSLDYGINPLIFEHEYANPIYNHIHTTERDEDLIGVNKASLSHHSCLPTVISSENTNMSFIKYHIIQFFLFLTESFVLAFWDYPKATSHYVPKPTEFSIFDWWRAKNWDLGLHTMS